MRHFYFILIGMLVSCAAIRCGDTMHDIYDLSLYPQPSLYDIQLSSGIIAPAFEPTITNYTVSISEDTESVTVKIALDPSLEEARTKGEVTILLNGSVFEPGIDSDPVLMDIWNKENNVITIELTHKKKKRVYTIEVDLVPLAGESFRDAVEMVDDGTGDQTDVSFDGKYRDDLANHPGCVKRASYDANTGLFTGIYGANEATVPLGYEANIPGYPCAAKEYVVTEDTSKPIVILAHGVATSPNLWEEFYLSTGVAGSGAAGTESTSGGLVFNVDQTSREMLAAKLVKNGFRTIAVDFRTELIMTVTGFNSADYNGKNYINPSVAFDHGWTVPLLQSLLRAVITNNPTRKISIIGHSLGATTVRDALRRLFVEYLDNKTGAVNPWLHVRNVVLLNGVNHGILTWDKNTCSVYFSMNGRIYCQLGDREIYQPTYFMKPLNGTRDKWTTPCGDGSRAFDVEGYCGNNAVRYMTMVIADNVLVYNEATSEKSSRLDSPYCNNAVLDNNSLDTSGFFFGGANAHHFSGPRSEEGMQKIVELLAH